jgi:hypothetical protein
MGLDDGNPWKVVVMEVEGKTWWWSASFKSTSSWNREHSKPSLLRPPTPETLSLLFLILLSSFPDNNIKTYSSKTIHYRCLSGFPGFNGIVAHISLASLLRVRWNKYAAESSIASINVTADTIVRLCIQQDGAWHAYVRLLWSASLMSQVHPDNLSVRFHLVLNSTCHVVIQLVAWNIAFPALSSVPRLPIILYHQKSRSWLVSTLFSFSRLPGPISIYLRYIYIYNMFNMSVNSVLNSTPSFDHLPVDKKGPFLNAWGL